jgi:hypothetical protein
MTKRNWPTREEWTRNRTTVFADMDNPNPASKQLADYASSDEIAAAIEAIKAARRETLRAERAAGLPAKCSYKLPELNDVLRQLKDGLVPWRWVGTGGLKTPPPPLDEIRARYEAACQQANERWEQDVAQRPVDDAAWAKELEWRREHEQRWKDGPRIIEAGSQTS